MSGGLSIYYLLTLSDVTPTPIGVTEILGELYTPRRSSPDGRRSRDEREGHYWTQH